MSGLYGNPCVPEQSSSTSNRYEKASHREWADMLGRIGTPVQGANMKGNSLGNRLRRKDILPPFRMFYSLLLHPNEWLDGALVTSYTSNAVETYFTRIIRLSWNSIAGIARAQSRWSGPSPPWPVRTMMIAPGMLCWQPIRRNGVWRLRVSF